ncbi:solute carrier family 22 member 1-like [Rhipicephalus sanguineus]|uniref:solute carrier family 22 member 1-like n=1 Tax=Rhipicephalus sanguineus TaxID=34632 RepID=UPI001894091B|nr:solute carrier family 22 member 1-like [Rhipicephalus sanguineus]
MMRAARLNGVSRKKAQFLWKDASKELNKNCERWSAVLRESSRGVLMTSPYLRYILVMLLARFSWSLAYMSAISHVVRRSTLGSLVAKSLATLDMASVVASIAFIERYGRRRTVATCFFISGVSWALIVFVHDEDYLEYAVLLVLGLAAQSLAGTVLPVMNVELFPQLVRTFGYCWGEGSNVLGALGSPYIMLLADNTYPWLPLALFSVLGLISGALTLTLPETARSAGAMRPAARIMCDPAIAPRSKNTKGGDIKLY